MADTIYFLSAEDRIKVGTSIDVPGRIRELSAASGVAITLIGTIPGGRHLEQAIHREIHQFRLRGEWFRDCPEVRSLVADLMERGSEAINFTPPVKRRREHPSPLRTSLFNIDPLWESLYGRLFKLVNLINATGAFSISRTLHSPVAEFGRLVETAFDEHMDNDPIIRQRAEIMVSNMEIHVRRAIASGVRTIVSSP